MNPGICEGCKKQVDHRVWIEDDVDADDNISHFPLELCEVCTEMYHEWYRSEGLEGVWNHCRENENV